MTRSMTSLAARPVSLPDLLLRVGLSAARSFAPLIHFNCLVEILQLTLLLTFTFFTSGD